MFTQNKLSITLAMGNGYFAMVLISHSSMETDLHQLNSTGLRETGRNACGGNSRGSSNTG